MNRISQILCIGICLLTLTACPPNRSRNDLKKIQDNNMDLPELMPESYQGIRFMLSDLFRNSHMNDFALSGDDAMCKVIWSIDLFFSVEVFGSSDVREFQNEFEVDIEPIDAVHDYYILKREGSLIEPITSIKKELPPSVKFPGYIQVVNGKLYEDNSPSDYFTATLQVGEEYYVFQMIGRSDNMGYLLDDFVDILSSVQ